MTNPQKIAMSSLEYSPQAALIIESLNFDFPIDAFEHWMQEAHPHVVGGGYVLEFLELRKQKVDNAIKKVTNNPLPDLNV